jgi:hypothetical protein
MAEYRCVHAARAGEQIMYLVILYHHPILSISSLVHEPWGVSPSRRLAAISGNVVTRAHLS